MFLPIPNNQHSFCVLVILSILGHTVYPKKYAHGFVVLCFVVVTQSFIMNSHEVFIHIHQGCFAGTGAIVRLPQCQWSKPDGYGKISQCITTTKHSKAKTVCIFLGIYCTLDLKWCRFIFIMELIYQVLESLDCIILYHYIRPHHCVIHVITPITVLFEQHWIPYAKPMTRSFDVFFDLHRNKRLSKQSRRQWFETASCSLLCHCSVLRPRCSGRTRSMHVASPSATAIPLIM